MPAIGRDWHLGLLSPRSLLWQSWDLNTGFYLTFCFCGVVFLSIFFLLGQGRFCFLFLTRSIGLAQQRQSKSAKQNYFSNEVNRLYLAPFFCVF